MNFIIWLVVLVIIIAAAVYFIPRRRSRSTTIDDPLPVNRGGGKTREHSIDEQNDEIEAM